MPNIIQRNLNQGSSKVTSVPKPKKKVAPKSKKQIISAPNLPKTAKRTPKSKHSTLDYYNCLLTYANQNWHHPVTGQKKKITACCRDCKINAPALNSQRDKELVKLITSYKQAGDNLKQVGDSLAKLLQPIK